MIDELAELVEISSLIPWTRNPRHNDPAVTKLAAGIRRFGWTNPVLARRSDGRVVAGHTRLKAASLIVREGARAGDHASLSTVLAGAVPVRWGEWTDTEADALALADNRLGEIATWDDAALAEILAGLGNDAQGLGWSDDEIAAMLADAEPVPKPRESEVIEERWEVIATCKGEDEQARVLQAIMDMGVTCRALIS